MPPQSLRVEGLAELQRATSRLSRDFGKGIQEALQAGGEPVRSDASQLALTRISGMSRSRIPWWNMRIGVSRVSVYVAPEQRGRKGKGKRPQSRRSIEAFKRGMFDRAMVPAVEQNTHRIESEVRGEINELFRAWSRL